MKQHYFDEETAQNLLNQGLKTECMAYALPCVQHRLSLARRRLPPQTHWEDLESEYNLYLCQAIDRYDKSRDIKLFTLIQHYLTYAERNFIRDETKYIDKHMQLNEDSLLYYPQED